MSEEPVSQPVDAPPAPADPTVELQRERDDYRDRWMRKVAEFDNYRRRVDKERREQADEAVESLLLDVLAVVDDFERALTVDANAASDSADAYRKGVELIYAKFQDLLRKKGITPIAALGETFDPNIHQAVVHEASAEHREGEVTGELRKGYKIGERLLRPALVKVAKAS